MGVSSQHLHKLRLHLLYQNHLKIFVGLKERKTHTSFCAHRVRIFLQNSSHQWSIRQVQLLLNLNFQLDYLHFSIFQPF